MIVVKLRDRELLAALTRLRMTLPLEGDSSAIMRDVAARLKAGTQLRFRAMHSPEGAAWPKSRRVAQGGGQTLSDSRRLRNSITAAHDRTTATVGTNVAYAAIHQFGGVIRAKRGPFLAIPITSTARAAGSPRNMPGLHVWQTLKGNYVMGDDKGNVHYLLRPSVKMPQRKFLGVSQADGASLTKVVQAHLEAAWRR